MVTWTSGGIELEADARHAELLAELVGQQGARVTTTIIKASVEDVLQAEPDSPLLEGSDVWAFKSLTIRAAYLAQDRPDLAYCVRELAKGMAYSKEVHQVSLKRMARYVRHRPRMVQLFPFQGQVSCLAAWSDAGCVRRPSLPCPAGRASTTRWCHIRHMCSAMPPWRRTWESAFGQRCSWTPRLA